MRRRAGRGPAPVSGCVEEGKEWLASRGGRLAACYAAGQINRRRLEAGPPLTHFGLVPDSYSPDVT